MNIEVKVPDIGKEEVEITDILVCIGEIIKKETGLIIVEGQKTSMEIPSSHDGIVKEIIVNIGDRVNTGTLIMILETCESVLLKDNTDDILSSSETLENQSHNIKIRNDKKNNFIKNKNLIHASPVVRRIARELDVDLQNIIGTGPKQRILKEDIENYQNKKYNKENELKSMILNDSINSAIDSVKEIPLTKIEQMSGKNLYNSWNGVPHVTQFDESDITELEQFRIKYNHSIQDDNNAVKLTLLAFMIKVISYALEKFPRFNSSLSHGHKSLIIKKYINIGIAVNTSHGLLVPVLKNTNLKNLLEIATEIKEISEKARSNTLNILNMKNSSFTISNLGGIGGSIFTPIINAPEVGILGISKALIKPIWNEKKFIPRLMLPLSLSYDHRVIDGVYAAHFIVFINKLLSDIRLTMI